MRLVSWRAISPTIGKIESHQSTFRNIPLDADQGHQLL
jgi:hypothetical protein